MERTARSTAPALAAADMADEAARRAERQAQIEAYVRAFEAGASASGVSVAAGAAPRTAGPVDEAALRAMLPAGFGKGARGNGADEDAAMYESTRKAAVSTGPASAAPALRKADDDDDDDDAGPGPRPPVMHGSVGPVPRTRDHAGAPGGDDDDEDAAVGPIGPLPPRASGKATDDDDDDDDDSDVGGDEPEAGLPVTHEAQMRDHGKVPGPRPSGHVTLPPPPPPPTPARSATL